MGVADHDHFAGNGGTWSARHWGGSILGDKGSLHDRWIHWRDVLGYVAPPQDRKSRRRGTREENEYNVTPGSQTKSFSWLPSTMLYGGILVAALIAFPQYLKLLAVGWVACLLGILSARYVGGFLPDPGQAVQRALLETLVRPAFPLFGCVAVALSVPHDEAKIFAASLVAFFLTMLTFDRLMFVASMPTNKSLTS